MFAAVVTGQGFDNPRKLGIMMLVAAVVFSIVNSILIFVVRISFPYFYALAAIFFWSGAWLAITGQPKANADGSPAPMWARIGLGVTLALGALSCLGTVLRSIL